jgi:levansucrase
LKIQRDNTFQRTMSDEHSQTVGPPWAGTPAWSREDAAGITRTEATVAPIIYPPADPVSDSVFLWDTWLLRTRDGSIATPGGYRVVFALTAPRDVLPGKRHDIARIRCFYSADGRTWENAGPVFDPDASLGSRQWAGCALYDPTGPAENDLYLYYTAAGENGEEELSYGQRIALAEGGEIVTGNECGAGEDTGGLTIDGSWDHSVLLEPDGEFYETQAQSRGMIYTFRDPWFFEDPETGETHLLFEANAPVPEGSDRCGGDTESQSFNGCVGLATSTSGDPTEFELDAPLLHSVCVNQELERPHVIVRDGRYNLFVSSHEHTFVPELTGYDALYGFQSESLRGQYEPLNDSGLVVTNPANAPFQSYSWLAFPHEEEILVTSFFNYYDLDGRSLDDVAQLPEAEQFRRFGGTLAPTVRLALDDDRTSVLGTLDHGHLPLASESLPDLAAGRGGLRGGYDVTAPRALGESGDGDRQHGADESDCEESLHATDGGY